MSGNTPHHRLILQMPDTFAEQCQWFEHQLAGGQLQQLIRELRTLQPATVQPFDLQQLLAAHGPGILEHGLSILPETAFHQLLCHPDSLLDLQEYLLLSDSTYWDKLVQQQTNTVTVQRIAALVLAQIGPPATIPLSSAAPTRNWSSYGLVAAAMIIGLLLWYSWGDKQIDPPGGNGKMIVADATWGWKKLPLDELPTDKQAYLQAIADAGDEWFQRSPTSSKEFLRDLQAMRDGCTKLLAAPHPGLGLADRQWLYEKCVAWGTKLDQHLADAHTEADWQLVQTQANETVRKLVTALREKAKNVG